MRQELLQDDLKKSLKIEIDENGNYIYYHYSTKHGVEGPNNPRTWRLCKPIMTTVKHKYGKEMKYYVIKLPNWKGTTKCRYVTLASAIYCYFVGDIPVEYEVDHIDNDTLNNDLSNLRLLTKAENLKRKPRQGNQYTCGLSDEEYEAKRKEREVNRAYNKYYDAKKLYEKYDLFGEEGNLEEWERLLHDMNEKRNAWNHLKYEQKQKQNKN